MLYNPTAEMFDQTDDGDRLVPESGRIKFSVLRGVESLRYPLQMTLYKNRLKFLSLILEFL